MKIAIFLNFVALATSLTLVEYEQIRDRIITRLRAGSFPTAATILRLSFHDCVGGICDGCINLENEANNGLDTGINLLEEVYPEVIGTDGITISRADFWALAGRVGAEFGMPNMPGHVDFVSGVGSAAQIASFVSPFATFKTGRQDCDTSPTTTVLHTFPEPHMTHTELFNFMNNDFGLTTDQTVAIMGAHTVGQCIEENSGYRGHWLIDPSDMATTFDNMFYQIMLNTSVTWTKRNIANPSTGTDARPQYACSQDGVGCGIMLNTDLEMYYDLTLDTRRFLASCTIDAATTDCTRADTYDLAKSFAEDNDVWMAAFVAAYDVMTSIGYTSLTTIA